MSTNQMNNNYITVNSELERLRSENAMLLSLYASRCSGHCGGAVDNNNQTEVLGLHRLLTKAYDAIPQGAPMRDQISSEYESLAVQSQAERRAAISRRDASEPNPGWSVYQNGLFAPLLSRSTHRLHQQQQVELQRQMQEQQRQMQQAQQLYRMQQLQQQQQQQYQQQQQEQLLRQLQQEQIAKHQQQSPPRVLPLQQLTQVLNKKPAPPRVTTLIIVDDSESTTVEETPLPDGPVPMTPMTPMINDYPVPMTPFPGQY